MKLHIIRSGKLTWSRWLNWYWKKSSGRSGEKSFQGRRKEHYVKSPKVDPGWVAQLSGASSRTPKGCGFDFRSGHIGCGFNQHLGQVREEPINVSHMDVSLPFSKNQWTNISSGEDFLKTLRFEKLVYSRYRIAISVVEA